MLEPAKASSDLLGPHTGFKVKKKPFQGIVPRGCPCKPQLLCEKDPYHSTFNVECDFPTQPGNAYSVQKGSGMPAAAVSCILANDLRLGCLSHVLLWPA